MGILKSLESACPVTILKYLLITESRFPLQNVRARDCSKTTDPSQMIIFGFETFFFSIHSYIICSKGIEKVLDRCCSVITGDICSNREKYLFWISYKFINIIWSLLSTSPFNYATCALCIYNVLFTSGMEDFYAKP